MLDSVVRFYAAKNTVCGSCSSIETEIVSTQTFLSVLRVEWEVL